MDSAASFGLKTQARVGERREFSSPHLMVFSATHPESLRQNIKNIQQYVENKPYATRNVSNTLACRRERFRHRAFAIVGEDSTWDVSGFQRASQAPSVVLVFTGQGAQYAGMGKELFVANRTFRQSIKKLDSALDSVDPGRLWTLEGMKNCLYKVTFL